MDQQAAKQQIIDRIKQAENVLVTVSANPSIDQLAACIGLTLLINKMGKSATAVFSGRAPSVLEFLQPEKTLETNTDSLRDFIISLDKSKADKLRYKVEDQVVRIFITPYKTKLTEKDLNFGEGDFNVDAIIALGVADRAHLDQAITAHGRILHDAAVIAVMAGPGQAPNLGQLNWQDPNASSLSEMLVSISEAFGTGLIDNQIATAFLTGIVAETDRFSNKKTSPKVMTMSAQLMAAGANQQLVISKLQPPPPPSPPPSPPPPKPKAPPQAPVKKAPPAPSKPKEEPKKEEPKKDSGLLNVAHEVTETDGEEVEINTQEIHIDKQGNIKEVDDSQKNTVQTTAPKKDKAEDKIELPMPAAPPTPLPPPPLPKPMPLPTPPEPKAKSAEPPAPQDMTPTFGLPVSQQATPPSVPITPLDDLPPLPPPSPPPQVKLDEQASTTTNLGIPSAKEASVTTDATSEANHHALLDPLQKSSGAGAPFSADTTQSLDNGGLNVDPVNNGAWSGQSEFSIHSKAVNPPSTPSTPLDQLLAAQNSGAPPTAASAASSQGDLTADSARQAVENAYASVPFNPDLNPAAIANAQPVESDLHPAPAPNQDETPSLNLPGSQTPPVSTSPQQPPPPPPMPPPITPTDPNGPINTPYGPMPPPSL